MAIMTCSIVHAWIVLTLANIIVANCTIVSLKAGASKARGIIGTISVETRLKYLAAQ